MVAFFVMTQKTDFFDRIQYLTELFLSRRQRIKREKKERQRKKNIILDWAEAFIWAAGMVLLINQYLLQAYQIPSGSMIDTLLIGDRIFVNKLIYGPEILPGLGKLPSPVRPKRNDIIIFENPSYLSRGPAFDIAQRILYMLTLSLVDIDRDEAGEPKVHFLIKRAVGEGGDRFVTGEGELRILFSGETRWVRERDYQAERGWKHNLSRMIMAEEYPALEALGKLEAYRDMGLSPPESLRARVAGLNSVSVQDSFAVERARLETLRGVLPQDSRYRTLLARQRLGWYVPEGRIMPLGDNRDNSRDGRYFGPVRLTKVLGKGSLIYWPLWRRDSGSIDWRAGLIR